MIEEKKKQIKQAVNEIFTKSNTTNSYFEEGVVKNPIGLRGFYNPKEKIVIGTAAFNNQFNLTIDSIMRDDCYRFLSGFFEGLESDFIINHSKVKEIFFKFEDSVKQNLLNGELARFLDKSAEKSQKDEEKIENLNEKNSQLEARVKQLNEEKNEQTKSLKELLGAFEKCFVAKTSNVNANTYEYVVKFEKKNF